MDSVDVNRLKYGVNGKFLSYQELEMIAGDPSEVDYDNLTKHEDYLASRGKT